VRYLAVVLAGCGFSTSVSTRDAAELDATIADAAPDAWTVDACPQSYIAIGAGRYRPIMTLGSFWPNEATCVADSMAGWTHAAVFEMLAEAADVRAYLVALAPTARTYGVGAVQAPTAMLVGEGWVNFHDATLDPALWGIYAAVQQPDDGAVGTTASPEDHQQNLAFLDLDATGAQPYLRDGNGNGGYAHICECDGRPLGMTAQSYILGDVNRPPQ